MDTDSEILFETPATANDDKDESKVNNDDTELSESILKPVAATNDNDHLEIIVAPTPDQQNSEQAIILASTEENNSEEIFGNLTKGPLPSPIPVTEENSDAIVDSIDDELLESTDLDAIDPHSDSGSATEDSDHDDEQEDSENVGAEDSKKDEEEPDNIIEEEEAMEVEDEDEEAVIEEDEEENGTEYGVNYLPLFKVKKMMKIMASTKEEDDNAAPTRAMISQEAVYITAAVTVSFIVLCVLFIFVRFCIYFTMILLCRKCLLLH